MRRCFRFWVERCQCFHWNLDQNCKIYLKNSNPLRRYKQNGDWKTSWGYFFVPPHPSWKGLKIPLSIWLCFSLRRNYIDLFIFGNIQRHIQNPVKHLRKIEKSSTSCSTGFRIRLWHAGPIKFKIFMYKMHKSNIANSQ